VHETLNCRLNKSLIIYLIVLILLVGINDCLGLYSQVIKCMWWMPWQSEAMKDVIACEKLRGGGKYPLIRRFLNGETHLP
jgi:hypothetical protein